MLRSCGPVETELDLARQANSRGDFAEAELHVAAAIRLNPYHTGALVGMGMILAAQGRHPEALRTLLAILRRDPVNPEALGLATMEYLNLGEGKSAEDLARRLTKLQPMNDRAHFLLSSSLSLQAKFAEALEAIDRALGLSPTEPDYVVARAQLLGRLNWSSQAIAWYRRAIELHPSPELAMELADSLLHESRPLEAIHVLEQWISQAPGDVPHELLAQAYTEAQLHEVATTHWAEAGSSSGDPNGLIVNRATSEIYSGRLDVAEQLLCEALDRDPLEARLVPPLVAIRKITGSDSELVKNMERMRTSPSLEPGPRRDVCYALGKAYDDLGEYREAIDRYDEANRLAFELSPFARRFNADAWRSYTDLQIQFFTKERIRSLTEEGLATRTPLFIVGTIRSGTTLTEQILSSHSMVLAGGETTFWPDHREEIFDTRTRTFDTVAAKRLGHAYLRALIPLGSSAPYFTEKNPSNVTISSLIHCVFPNAKFIHVERHPVDNLLSIWMTPMRTGLPFVNNRENMVSAFRDHLRLTRHLQEVLPEDRFETFTYEDLTTDPSATISQMLKFLALDREEACFHPEQNPRMVRTPSVYTVRQSINTASQAKWKRYERWLGPFAEFL